MFKRFTVLLKRRKQEILKQNQVIKKVIHTLFGTRKKPEKLVQNNDFETVEDIKDHLKKGSLSSIRRALKKINFVKKKPKNLIKSKTKKKSKIT